MREHSPHFATRIALIGNDKRELPQGVSDVQKAPHRSQRHRRQRPEAIQRAPVIFH